MLLKAIDLKVNSQLLSCVSNKLFNVCFYGKIQRNQPTENLVHPWLEGARLNLFKLSLMRMNSSQEGPGVKCVHQPHNKSRRSGEDAGDG